MSVEGSHDGPHRETGRAGGRQRTAQQTGLADGRQRTAQQTGLADGRQRTAQQTGLADGTRLTVRGAPDEAEIVAALAAVDAARRADERAATPGRRPAWLRAARRESIHGRLIAAPGDLR